jgi:flavin reductase (DIM6/NTAB) family NADH-FMN oxidoreductase RutF
MKKSLGDIVLVYTMPVWVIGTYGKDGKPNAMTAAAGMVCCRKPPCLGIALREATYTYHTLMERQAFTVNIASETYAGEADYFGMVTGRMEDKFAATGLTPVRSDLVDAPYIDEFPVVLECKLINSMELGSHTLFIGVIQDVKAEETILGENDLPEIEKVKPLVYDVGNTLYHGVGPLLGKAYSLGKRFKV